MNTKPIKESICSYEQCKWLKRLGFDWDCFCRYEDNIEGIPWLRIGGYPANYNSGETCLSAPTVEYAHRWFRDKYGLLIYLTPQFEPSAPPYGYIIFLQPKWKCMGSNGAFYESYDEAMMGGIDHVLRLIESVYLKEQ